MSLGYKIKLIHAFNLQQFKRTMLSVFPPESFPNIGRKYLLIGKNQFRNDMLRDIAARKPEIQEYFRVFVGELHDEIRTEDIKIDENMLKK